MSVNRTIPSFDEIVSVPDAHNRCLTTSNVSLSVLPPSKYDLKKEDYLQLSGSVSFATIVACARF